MIDSSVYSARAARLIDGPALPDPGILDDLLTDGCAAALHLEAQLRRVQQQGVGSEHERARERSLLAEIDELQATIAALYAARARWRVAG